MSALSAVSAMNPVATPAKASQLHIAWDEHMLFGAPLTVSLDLATTTLNDVIAHTLPRLFGQHPNYPRIAWPQVQWFLAGQLISAPPQRTLAQLGVEHRSVLRFRTPGLDGFRGSGG